MTGTLTPSTPDASKTRMFVWTSLVITAIGGVVGFLAAQYWNLQERRLKELDLAISNSKLALEQLERNDHIVEIKLSIVREIKDQQFPTARAIMEYLLKPIESDEDDYNAFVDAISPALPVAQEPPVSTSSVSVDGSSFQYSIEDIRSRFSAPGRKKFSDELTVLYKTFKQDVVGRLILSILPEDDRSGHRYLNNLYVLYTLARLPGWTSTREEFVKFQALSSSKDYDDPTFSGRYREALNSSAM